MRTRGKNGASKRADGRWQATLDLGKDPTGKRRRKLFYGKTKSEAIAKRDQFSARMLISTFNLDSRLTVNRFAQEWLLTTAKANCKPNTVSGYQDHLNRYVLPIIGQLKLHEVKPMDIERVLASATANNLSVSSVRGVRRAMSSMFSSAERNSIIANNPVRKTLVPKQRLDRKTRKPKPLTEVEALNLLDHLNGNDLYSALFYLLLFTGLRRGEAIAIKWSDIKLTDSGYVLNIERQFQESRVISADGLATVELIVSAPKTQNALREIPLEIHVVEKLNQMRNGSIITNIHFGGDRLIFLSADNTTLWPSNVTKQWSKFLKIRGLRHMQLHGLRHTFATLALQAGTPLDAVTEALGHSSVAITKDLYASRVVGNARRATATLTAFLLTEPMKRHLRGVARTP